MKKTFKVLGIIILVAVIGFGVAACNTGTTTTGGNTGGGNTGGSGSNIELVKSPNHQAVVITVPGIQSYSQIATKGDYTLTIDGNNIPPEGSGIPSGWWATPNTYSVVNLEFSTPALEVGKTYTVTVTYTGNVSQVKGVIPSEGFSETLTCLSKDKIPPYQN